MALYYDVRVDISADKVIDSGYHFTQGDKQQIYMRIAVMNGANKFDASDSNLVTINFKKPDGRYVEGIPILTDDVYLYQFLGNELQADGTVIADIKFYYDSGRVSSGQFSFIVDKDTANDNAVKSTGVISSLEETRQEAESILASITNKSDEVVSIAEQSQYYSNIAESYAHGQTGKREGENTDNAKYYSEQASNYKNQAYQYTQDFKYTHVMYSAKADGSEMTATPIDDVTKYLGVYTGTSKTPPTTPSSYTWTKIRGNDGNAYFAVFDIINSNELIMTYPNNAVDIDFAINSQGELEVSY